MKRKKIKIQKADYYERFFDRTIRWRLEPYYDFEFSEKPDFLFYSVYGSGREHYKYSDCVKIFYAAEGVIPDFNECDYAVGSYPMNVGKRYYRIPYSPMQKEAQNREKYKNIELKSRKFCNFIYSNATNGRGAILRQEFCRELMKYKTVDCPGRVLNNMQDAIEPRDGNWYQGKLDFIKDYKFTIAFENVEMPGMISEKLTQSFEAGTIPIYWGDSGVTDFFDSKAFINCMEYSSWDEVIERIKELDNDDEKYMDMLLTPPAVTDYEFDFDKKVTDFLCDIIEKGNRPYDKDPLGWDAGSIAGKQIEDMHGNILYKLYALQKKVSRRLNKKKQP